MIRTIAIAIFSACLGLALADAPLRPPATYRVSSPNGQFTAICDPSIGTTVVESASGKKLFEIFGWHRAVFISDDGEHVAAADVGLLPLDARGGLAAPWEATELIGFWHRDDKIRSVSLREVVPDHSILQRTASHYAWGHIDGIDQGNRLVVTRIDGQVFRFNMMTGKAE